jgi:hypothetical protein
METTGDRQAQRRVNLLRHFAKGVLSANELFAALVDTFSELRIAEELEAAGPEVREQVRAFLAGHRPTTFAPFFIRTPLTADEAMRWERCQRRKYAELLLALGIIKNSSTNLSHLADVFCGLLSELQLEALARLAHELTIVARDTYEPGTLDVRHPQKLRALNEVQHRITSHMLALLTADPARYADDLLASIILEQDDPELGRQVAVAFARSLTPQAVI